MIKGEIEAICTARSILISLLPQNVHFNLFNSMICDSFNPPLLTSDVSLDINKVRIFLSISPSRRFRLKILAMTLTFSEFDLRHRRVFRSTEM